MTAGSHHQKIDPIGFDIRIKHFTERAAIDFCRFKDRFDATFG